MLHWLFQSHNKNDKWWTCDSNNMVKQAKQCLRGNWPKRHEYIFNVLEYTERHTRAFEAALANKLVDVMTSSNNTDKAAKNMTDWLTRILHVISIRNCYLGVGTVNFNPELKSMSSVASGVFTNFLKMKILSRFGFWGNTKIKYFYIMLCTHLSYVNILNC